MIGIFVWKLPRRPSHFTTSVFSIFAPDVPWVFDGTRFFGLHEARDEFARRAEDVLRQTGVRFEIVSGEWAQREAQARDAIARALG